MRRLFIYAIALLLCPCLYAQVMPFKNYGAKDGLNDNSVQALIRDDRGLLWVGTDFGLYWFDGKRFYQPQIKSNIGQFYVSGFYKDPDGAIWVLTFFNGLYKYVNGGFTNYLIDKKLKNATINTVTDMLRVGSNNYVVISDDCAYLFNGQKFSVFDPANPVLKTKTNSVAQLPDKSILLSTDSGVFIYQFNNGTLKMTAHVLKDRQISKVFITKKQWWVLAGKQLLSFENSGHPSFSNPSKIYLTNTAVRNITADKNGKPWFLTDNVFKIENEKTILYSSANGLPENIQQIYCDNEGLVWFATGKGISVLSDEYYEFNAITMGRNALPVSSVFTDGQNNLWLGTVDGLALKKDYGYRFFTTQGKQGLGYVSWFHKNKNGSFLVGTNAGVLKITGNSIKKEFNISSTAIDTSDKEDTWFGDISGHIWRYDGKVLNPFKIDQAVPEMITAIHADGKYLWVGYRDKGIIKYKISKYSLLPVKEYSAATGFYDMRIRSSATDEKGNIIYGTRTNGVFIFRMNSGRPVAHISVQNGLNANWIKAMFYDTVHKLYLATNNGINIVWGDYKNPYIKQLKINNDNIDRETNCIFKTGAVFYIGTNEGVLKLMPDKMHRDTVSPPKYFTNIAVPGAKNFSFNPYTANAGTASLSYDQHFISFEFAGISLKNPDNVKYHYILEGLDNEWGPVTGHNGVDYNLKPGNYVFKVAAENADGVWSRRPAVFHFIIRPPFWETWWFIMLTASIIVISVYTMYRYKLSKILALELLRNEISTNLHDDIGSTLSSISILSEVAAKEDEKKSKRMLGEINERTQLLMEKMDDIVWSISSRNDTVGNLFIRIQQFAASVLEAKDIEYEVRVPERVKEMKLDMQRRQHIYLILKEAINNLIKYSACTSAHITAEYAEGLLKIEVADNGKGFDIKKAAYGNGLNNMKKRNDAIGGKLLIVSAPGNGTRVILSVEIE
jgi:ligand-binding sensor domain-containing protein/two-component sensor histidine kinase